MPNIPRIEPINSLSPVSLSVIGQHCFIPHVSCHIKKRKELKIIRLFIKLNFALNGTLINEIQISVLSKLCILFFNTD